MSGVHRLLSKRDRDKNNPGRHFGKHHGNKNKSSPDITPAFPDSNSPLNFYGLFQYQGKSSGHDEERKVKQLQQKLLDRKGVLLKESHIIWVLRSLLTNGNLDGAYDVLLAMSDASEGLITRYDPGVPLLGAQNRQGVTCFLDATLFSMFSKLDSFEAMLYNTFDDISRNKLGFLLRLWVNLLRSGKLITTDITQVVQDALGECGWEEATKLKQQDASEAFTFVTEKLKLPLLTLKMDIYHTGKEDATDDHKFINERLLEVAIPSDPDDSQKEFTLEDCLEEYFNNRIEVRRYLERRSTLNSVKSFDAKTKAAAVHIETIEVDSDSTPTTPMSSSPGQPPYPLSPNRHRAPSIIQERYFPPRSESGYSSLTTVDTKSTTARLRAGSVRKEVMMPAWQFFSLIPWYTDNTPSSDAQVAAHFSSKRPILGLCLKRYAMTPKGPVRLGTKIDIPLEIGLPHFIQDDHLVEDGPLYGNFKLLLQSVVCHRGNSLHSGHYIALVRGSTPASSNITSTSTGSDDWIRFDDMAQTRISAIDIEKALKEETPYLLFYQIVPVDGDPGDIAAGEHLASLTAVDGYSSNDLPRSLETARDVLPTRRSVSAQPKLEITRGDDSKDLQSNETRRRSLVAVPDSISTAPIAETEETSTNSSSSLIPADGSSSQVQSKAGDGLGRTLSRLRGRRSIDAVADARPRTPEVHVKELSNTSHGSQKQLMAPGVAKPHPLGEEKLGKSKNRLSKVTGRAKNDHPERECVMM